MTNHVIQYIIIQSIHILQLYYRITIYRVLYMQRWSMFLNNMAIHAFFQQATAVFSIPFIHKAYLI